MTSPSNATLVGGPLDGSVYTRRSSLRFPTRLNMEINGKVHLYVAIVSGVRVFYRHAGARTVEVVS